MSVWVQIYFAYLGGKPADTILARSLTLIFIAEFYSTANMGVLFIRFHFFRIFSNFFKIFPLYKATPTRFISINKNMDTKLIKLKNLEKPKKNHEILKDWKSNWKNGQMTQSWNKLELSSSKLSSLIWVEWIWGSGEELVLKWSWSSFELVLD